MFWSEAIWAKHNSFIPERRIDQWIKNSISRHYILSLVIKLVPCWWDTRHLSGIPSWLASARDVVDPEGLADPVVAGHKVPERDKVKSISADQCPEELDDLRIGWLVGWLNGEESHETSFSGNYWHTVIHTGLTKGLRIAISSSMDAPLPHLRCQHRVPQDTA